MINITILEITHQLDGIMDQQSKSITWWTPACTPHFNTQNATILHKVAYTILKCDVWSAKKKFQIASDQRICDGKCLPLLSTVTWQCWAICRQSNDQVYILCMYWRLALEELHTSRVPCQKGPICHAWAWQVGPFWQDTLNMTFGIYIGWHMKLGYGMYTFIDLQRSPRFNHIIQLYRRVSRGHTGKLCIKVEYHSHAIGLIKLVMYTQG